jgi:hypothetical protein
MDTTTAAATSAPNRVLIWAGAGIALLIAATAALAVLRQPATFAEGTPEATVQAYAQAIVTGDEDAALALLDPDLGCTARDLRDAHVGDSVRVTLRDADVTETAAEVEIVVTVTSGHGPFDTYEYDESHRFELARSSNEWLITRRPWPWASCWR